MADVERNGFIKIILFEDHSLSIKYKNQMLQTLKNQGNVTK